MKNLISKKSLTLAALLAAGTVFANAGESLVIDVNDTNFTVNGNTATKLLEGLTISVVASAASLTTSVTTGGNAAQYGWYDSTKSTLFVGDNAWGLAASSTYLVSNKNSLTVTISGYAASQTGIDLSFVAGIPFEGAGTWANIATLNSNNIVTGTTAGAAYYVGYNDNGTQTLSSATFPFSGTVTPFSAVIYDFSGVTADASGAISFTVNGAAAHSAGLSAIKLSVIPEPSAFGLLAGLGALALAGARRRRSRK